MIPSLPSAFKLRLAGTLLAFAGPTAFGDPSAPGFVHETATEFHTRADLTGNGNTDLIVADKETGEFRVAEGASDGTVTWRNHPGDSGLGSISDLTAGRVLDNGRDVLLFADAFVNRIQLIDTPDDAPFVERTFHPFDGVGPGLVTAIDAPGVGAGYNTKFDDVLIHSVLEIAGSENVFYTQPNPDGTLPLASNAIADFGGIATRANRVVLVAGAPDVYAYLRKETEAAEFILIDPTDPDFPELAKVSRLPADSAYVYADFDGDGAAEFLFFVPGSSEIYWSRYEGGSKLSDPLSINYPTPVGDIRVIDSSGTPQLLIVHADGATADVVDYPGAGSFSLEESFHAGEGELFTGGVSIGERLHLLSGDSQGRSHRLQTYSYDGDSHQLEDEQDLTTLRPAGSVASVLVFDDDPLIESDARLLGALEAGPWTSAFRLDSGTITVDSERFLSPEEGLGDRQEVTLDAVPAGTAGGLTTQVDTDLSLFFRDRAIGEVFINLEMSPKSGAFARAIRPEFTLSGPGNVFYRTTQSPSWQFYNPDNPPTFFTDTTVTAVAIAPGNRFSNIVQATYAFPLDPAAQDSNGNGLPDFVMAAHGLDPLTDRTDSSGNGFTDFQEILAGTNPLDPDDKPDRGEVSFEFPNSFDLFAVPATVDPENAGESFPSFARPEQPGSGFTDRSTKMTVHQPNGFFLGASPTLPPLATGDPAAIFRALEPADDALFLIVTTEPRFEVDAGQPEEFGRQTAAIIQPPKQDFAPFEYTDFGEFGGSDDLEAEADAWRSQAVDYYNGLERPQSIQDPVDYKSTVILLLVESILGERLYDRDLVDRPNISITPFRATERPLQPGEVEEESSDRNRAVTTRQLLDLQLHDASGGSDSYRIDEVIVTVETAVLGAETGDDIFNLGVLAERLYRGHASYPKPGSLRAPFDALRRFIRTGDLENTGYLDENLGAELGIPPGLITSAGDGVDQVKALVAPRQTATVHLYYDGGSIGADCATWKEVDFNANTFDPEDPTLTGVDYALLDDRGRPFPVSRAFPLTDGTVFRVTGFVLDDAPCGDVALEVVPQPQLVFINNTSPPDSNGDLIPDTLQNLNPGVSLSPFADSNGNGYSDLQEILAGSDPYDPSRVPMKNGKPAPVADLSPPNVRISSNENGLAQVDFEFPPEYAGKIAFRLFKSDDLSQFTSTGKSAVYQGGGNFQTVITQDENSSFYIFQMELK